MDIIELFIEDGDDPIGIEAISVVESPAIEEDFIALKDHQVKFAEIDAEKKILLGAALIPNKPIYRKNGEDEYYIYFSKKTVRKASELFFINGNQNNSTLEHEIPLTGLSAVESWIIEDEVQDKSRKYGLSLPVGTWMVSMKVNNDEIWNDYVKTGKVKGFSIEGYFADKLERPKDKVKDDLSKKDKTSLESKVIDGRMAYDTKEEAIAVSEEMGCGGYHTHNLDGQEWFMPCESHNLKAPCYDGYEMIGTKMKNGKKVPNCVPIKQSKMSKEEKAKEVIDELKQLFTTQKVKLSIIQEALQNADRLDDISREILLMKKDVLSTIKRIESDMTDGRERYQSLRSDQRQIKQMSKDLGIDIPKLKIVEKSLQAWEQAVKFKI